MRSVLMWLLLLLLGCCTTCWATSLKWHVVRPDVPRAHDTPRVKCSLNKTHLPVPTVPTALMSFPGSGNTWIRHVIETLTGYHTGSVYCDTSLLPVFTQECAHNKWNVSIVVKTHKFHCTEWNRAIVIIRNPLYAILADYQRKKTRSHTGVIAPEDWSWEDWHGFAGSYCEAYKNVYGHVFGSGNKTGCADQREPEDYKVFFYEDLKTPSGSLNPYFLEELLKYFAINKADSFYDCALSKSKGHYARKYPPNHPAVRVVNDTVTVDILEKVGCSIMYNEVRKKIPRLLQPDAEIKPEP